MKYCIYKNELDHSSRRFVLIFPHLQLAVLGSIQVNVTSR